MTIIQRKFQNQSNGSHRHGRVKTPEPFTSQEFLQLAKKIKATQAEQSAHGLSGVCKAQRAAHDKVERHSNRIPSAFVALHSSLEDDQWVTAEKFVEVLQPFTSSVLDRDELMAIFSKLDAKSVGQIRMRLSEEENRKEAEQLERQYEEMKKKKSARARLQKAVGAVQNMRRSLKSMLMAKKSTKAVVPFQEFDSIAPPQVATSPSSQKQPAHSILKKEPDPEQSPIVNGDNDGSEDEEEAQELANLEKKIAALKAAKEAKEKKEQDKQRLRDAKMEALRKELEALQNDGDSD